MSVEREVKVTSLEANETYGRFTAGPLEKGEGVTLGNALRRVLLGSIQGAAVNWIRLDGVQHEFSTIPHIKEDVSEFILNVKALRLRPLSGRPGRLTLEVAGEGKVTAADIEPSNDFDIANPELHLATLDSAEAKLSVEFNVELGRGYTPAGHLEGQPIGVIPVDAIFSPMRKVNFSVEHIRIGQETTYEQLNLEVWTDGTISPVEAVAKSADLLLQRFTLFVSLSRPVEKVAEKEALRHTMPPEQYNMSLEQVGFSVRTFNCLKRGGVNILGELLEKSEAELMAMRHFGEKSRQEVREKLQAMGYILPLKHTEETPPPEPAPEPAEEVAAQEASKAGES